MGIIETNHTFGAIEKIKKDISKFVKIMSISSMAIFFAYYIYLIITNINSIVHIVLYSILFATIIATFITELVIGSHIKGTRKEKRINKEKKRLIFAIIKGVKYVAKSVIVVVTAINIFKNGANDLTKLSTIFSGGLIISQLILDFIVYWLNYYFDYLKLAVEKDIETSMLIKIVKPLKSTEQLLEAGAFKLEGHQQYTLQELKMIEEIEKNASEYKKEQSRKTIMGIKRNAGRIAVGIKEKLQQKSITKVFNKNQKNAVNILNKPNKLEELLKKAEDFASKLPAGIDELKYLPLFLSFINNYLSKKYTDVSSNAIVAMLAVVIYILNPFDIIPDTLPAIGYADDVLIIKECLKIIQNELDKYNKWRDKNLLTA